MMRTVLITGAGGGLGTAMVKKFASEGLHVIATDVDETALESLQDICGVTTLVMDVASDESVRAGFESLQRDHVFLDLIINNAAIDRYFPFAETDTAQFDRMLQVNVLGAVRVNQIMLPLLYLPGGRIIHIGSESSAMTMPFMPYPLTKGLLEAYAKSLRIELSFLGIDVVTVKPGAIETPLLQNVRRIAPIDSASPFAPLFNRFVTRAPSQIGRTSSPAEVAAFVFRVSQKKNPAPCYRINNMWKLRLSALLPFRLMEKIVKKLLRVEVV